MMLYPVGNVNILHCEEVVILHNEQFVCVCTCMCVSVCVCVCVCECVCVCVCV